MTPLVAKLRHSLVEDGVVVSLARKGENTVLGSLTASDARRFAWAILADLEPDEKPPVPLTQRLSGSVINARAANRVKSFTDLERKLRRGFKLQPTTVSVLVALYKAKGEYINHQTIKTKVWGPDNQPLSRSVDVFICKLRKALGAESIATELWSGYALTKSGMALCKSVVEGNFDVSA